MLRSELDFSRDLLSKSFSQEGLKYNQSRVVPQPSYRNDLTLPGINELGLTNSSSTSTSSPGPSNHGYYIDYHPPTYFFPSTTYYNNHYFPYRYMTTDPNTAFYMGVRRHRVTSAQKEVLSKVFKQSFFPSTDTRNKLAHDLGMTPRTVQIWFQNKRQAWRTKHKTSSFHHHTQDSMGCDDPDPEDSADSSPQF